jgi:parallel beta-helix repeat protein
MTIQNNVFYDGSMGICLYGKSSYLTPNLQILNNQFVNQSEHGIYLQYQNAPLIKDNTFELDKNPANGIYLDYCDNDYQVLNNKINMASQGQQGINLNYCDGNQTQKGLLANNFISIQGTSTARGIYMNYCTYQNIYYNSVNIVSTMTGTNACAFYSYSGSNIDVRNNIFANFGGSYAFYVSTPSAISNSDYNNYFTSGNFIAYWNNNIQDIADLRTATTKDNNSFSLSPIFTTESDLHSTPPLLTAEVLTRVLA